jgi:HlyD family secretion protein
MKRIAKARFIICVIVSAALLAGIVSCRKGNSAYTYTTGVARKGSIINIITASGTIQADTTVAVGTQVSGVVRKIYVDFNTPVRKGQLIAELDKTPLETQVQQAEASLEDAKSEVEFQKVTFERYKALLDKKLVAQADFDQVKYNYDKAKANLKTSQAGYDKSIVNLNYATILSPISGVVLNRAVDQGQTVAASFNTPTLFSIGNDMTHMQLQANVDEADIGMVKKGQPVSFTVEAFPSETFKGDVRQIRFQPIVTNNVVTYTVIVNAPNPDQKLMPGMTANITVLVQKVDSVLLVPGAALRFAPDQAFLTEYYKKNPPPWMKNREGGAKGGFNQVQAGGQADSPFGGQAGQGWKKPNVVWIKNGDKIQRKRVEIGATDQSNTEIKSGLEPGDTVIVTMTAGGGAAAAAAKGQQTTATSPFMPQRPGATRR